MGEDPAPGGEDSRLWTAELRHPTLLCGLTMERSALYERIDARVDAMIACRRRRARSRAPTPRGRAARRAPRSASRSCSRGDHEAMKRRTRNYAKRQLAWMRRLPDVHPIDLTDREPADGRRRDRPYTGRRPEERKTVDSR